MKHFIAIILIIFFYIIFPANAILVSSETLPSPPTEWTYPKSFDTSTSSTKQVGPSQRESYDSGTSVYFTAPAQTGSPLEIERHVSPQSKDGLMVNNPANVLVEVKCAGGRSANNLEIFESVDKNLTISHFYGYFIAKSPRELINMSGIFLSTKPFDEINNTINILENLTSKQILLYKYDITPKKEGIYPIETIARIGKEFSTQSDLRLYSEVDTREAIPNFDVRVDVKKLKLGNKDFENLTYILEYVGGSTNPISRPIRLDNDSGVFRLIHIDPINNSFSTHKTRLINATISYINDGIYNIPGIWIGERYYPFEKQIEVFDSTWEPFTKWTGIFSQILTTLAAFLALWFSNIRKEITQKREEHKRQKNQRKLTANFKQ